MNGGIYSRVNISRFGALLVCVNIFFIKPHVSKKEFTQLLSTAIMDFFPTGDVRRDWKLKKISQEHKILLIYWQRNFKKTAKNIWQLLVYISSSLNISLNNWRTLINCNLNCIYHWTFMEPFILGPRPNNLSHKTLPRDALSCYYKAKKQRKQE